MRILLWVPYPKEGPSNRYRVEQYLPYLHKINADFSLRYFWSSKTYAILYKDGYFFRKVFSFIVGAIKRIIDIIFIYLFDLVFIHREAFPIGGAFFERLVWLLGKKIIFDFDDAIFSPSVSKTNSFVEKLKSHKKIITIIKISSFVIAGNAYLADFARQYNKNVLVIPTSIDTERYAYPERIYEKKEIVIGWMGSFTTVEFLSMLKNVFVALSRKFSNISFKIIGGSFSMDGLSNVVSKAWSLTDELDDLKSIDIGIMPMPDNQWTRGKCGFKAILYMSMAIPSVCSDVGVNKEIIADGVNGFLADTEKEWIDKLSLLIKDGILRKNLGLAGQKTIEERFSVRVNSKRFLETILKVYEKGKR